MFFFGLLKSFSFLSMYYESIINNINRRSKTIQFCQPSFLVFRKNLFKNKCAKKLILVVKKKKKNDIYCDDHAKRLAENPSLEQLHVIIHHIHYEHFYPNRQSIQREKKIITLHTQNRSIKWNYKRTIQVETSSNASANKMANFVCQSFHFHQGLETINMEKEKKSVFNFGCLAVHKIKLAKCFTAKLFL